ncbi:PAS and HAMP domain-containing histidine kinase [Candidatus Bealeia paramacronuclearis]|uniref:histidine kinase n=1 Tax=Candidatus Bealeia paramacronuclearis TaxID=1921001 RepID=A0ABZ2C3R3_9PROT|nr:PAS and HAMP domain-containing histidine kinase [Candidatus Bealeia paramacronuclearis]
MSIECFFGGAQFKSEFLKSRESKNRKINIHSGQDKRMIIQAGIQKTFFENIIKNIPAALAVFDNDLNYLVTSKRWNEQTNLNPTLIMGQNMYEVVPDIPKKWKDIHQRGLQGENLKSDEDIFKRADGSIEWFRWEVLPWYEDENTIGGIILFVEQITKRKTLEKKMKSIIKALNTSNSELERFAHICAHDLNEPLRTISNYIQILESELKDNLDNNSKDYLDNITKNVKHMSNLVNGLLAYSQFGTQCLRVSSFSLGSIIESVKMSLEDKICQKNAEVRVPLNLPKIEGDMALISRVIQNILSNSLKFNENPQSCIEITMFEKKKFWIISFQDNGIGIDPKFHKSIFRIFNRLHPLSDYPGTGMGLCICKKIIEAHGGKIWVETPASGEGTIFSLSLPKKIEKRVRLDFMPHSHSTYRY